MPKKLCRPEGFGNSATIECLRRESSELSVPCRQIIFKRELEEAKDPATDYVLVSKCKGMIKKYCIDEIRSTDSIFICLQQLKEKDSFDEGCRKVIQSREQLRAHDIRLNPELERSCLSDTKKYCSTELRRMKATGDSSMEGELLLCLRNQFAKKSLSPSCEKYVDSFVRESSMDFTQDLALVKACSKEVSSCRESHMNENSEEDKGRTQECLKGKLAGMTITLSTNKDCFMQVKRLMEESQVDIHADVVLLRNCLVDLKQHCSEIERGEGRQMKCLISIYNRANKQLDAACNNTFTERIQMWQIVVPAASLPDSVEKLVIQAYHSPSRNYFAIVSLVFIGAIFIVGLVCGKVTKRVSRGVKDR